MLLLIDGYNLLKTIERAKRFTRETFINLINTYAQRKKHTILIVFDAGPTVNATKERHGEITVFYSGARQSADEVIQEVLDVYEDQKNILLISSDMQLKNYAKLRNIPAIDSELFAQFLSERKIKTLKQEYAIKGKIHKLQKDNEPELDQLMMQDIRFVKDEDYQTEEESKLEWLKELSGNDKKLITILKKL